jgi:hypothetical protein
MLAALEARLARYCADLISAVNQSDFIAALELGHSNHQNLI